MNVETSQVKDARILKLNEIAGKINEALEIDFDNQGLIVSECRDKKLKNTQSWSSNILLKYYHRFKQEKSEKADKSMKDFIESLRPVIEKLDVRLEPSGFLTIIDMTPAILEPVVKK
jgi:hypothetical protein